MIINLILEQVKEIHKYYIHLLCNSNLNKIIINNKLILLLNLVIIHQCN